MYDKYELQEKLYNGVVTVTFTKKDGTIREMNCTLNPEYLPETPVLLREEGYGRKVSEEVLAVWDTDVGGWRSFRLDSVSSVKTL